MPRLKIQKYAAKHNQCFLGNAIISQLIQEVKPHLI